MTTVTWPKLLRPHVFAKALEDAGIIHEVGLVRRVVIDVNSDEPVVVVHIERWGDERMLDIAQSLDGVEIREVSRQAQQPAEPGKEDEA